MAGSVPIVDSTVQDAPKTYAIRTGQVIELLGVRASFVDNGAASNWLPQVQILDANGNILHHASDQGVKVTAGSDADVSWFPGVKTSSTGGGGGGASLSWAYISKNKNISCPHQSTTVLTGDVNNFYTNAPSIYEALDDGFGNAGITILANGHYFSYVATQTFGTPAAGSLYEIITDGGGAIASLEIAPTNVLFPGGGNTDLGRVSEGVIQTVGGFITPPTQPLQAQLTNAGTNDLTFAGVAVFVYQLDTDPTDIT